MAATTADTSAPVVLLVGAGISTAAPACLPSADDLKKAVIDGLLSRVAKPAVTEVARDLIEDRILKGLTLESVLQAVQDTLPEESKNAVYSVYEDYVAREGGTPNDYHVAIASLCRSGRVRHVITTNQDPLLERALAQVYCMAEADFAVFSERSAQDHCPQFPAVLHLHGVTGLNGVAAEQQRDSLAITLKRIGRGVPDWVVTEGCRLAGGADMPVTCYSGCDYDVAALVTHLRRGCQTVPRWYHYRPPGSSLPSAGGRLRAILREVGDAESVRDPTRWLSVAGLLNQCFGCDVREAQPSSDQIDATRWCCRVAASDALVTLAWLGCLSGAQRGTARCLRSHRPAEEAERVRVALPLAYSLRSLGWHRRSEGLLRTVIRSRASSERQKARAQVMIGESRSTLERMPVWVATRGRARPAGLSALEASENCYAAAGITSDGPKAGPSWVAHCKGLAWRRLAMIPWPAHREAKCAAITCLSTAIERLLEEGDTNGAARALGDLRGIGPNRALDFERVLPVAVQGWDEIESLMGNAYMLTAENAFAHGHYRWAAHLYENAATQYECADMHFETWRNRFMAAVSELAGHSGVRTARSIWQASLSLWQLMTRRPTVVLWAYLARNVVRSLVPRTLR